MPHFFGALAWPDDEEVDEVCGHRARPAASDTGAIPAWLLAASVYLMAVLHRTSLGVAGLAATSRFHIGASQLSIFVLLQLGVYAAMQVPTGVLVDRFGPRRLLVVAAGTMAGAQMVFALVDNYPMALLARAVLGAGDALTFVSVLRFAAARFSPRRYPVIVGVTGTVGMLGNLLATFPLSRALNSWGWTTSFAVIAIATAVTGVAVWLLLPDPPTPKPAGIGLGPSMSAVARELRAAWTVPGTRVGFWLHFTNTSATTAFGVLWGLPYLVTAGKLSVVAASEVLMLGVAVAFVGGPALGAVLSRRPGSRIPFAVGVGIVTAVGWLIVLAPARPDPVLVTVLVAVMALGGPASMGAFGLARDYNDRGVIGTATGLVNVGGFLATVLIVVCVGWALSSFGGVTAAAFRPAMLVFVAVQLVGLTQLLLWWRRARAYLLVRQARGDTLPVRLTRRWLDYPPA